MFQGKVKWFDSKKGYGFIARNDGGKDVFVHYSDIDGIGRKDLVEGEIVDFDVQSSEKGDKAVNVRRIEQ